MHAAAGGRARLDRREHRFLRIVSTDWVTEMTRPRSDMPEESRRYGLGFWLQPSGEGVELHGYDAGVSFRSTYDPLSAITATVVSNTSEGTWPIETLLDERMSN